MADTSVALILGYVLGALGGFLLIVVSLAILIILCGRRQRIKKEKYAVYKTGKKLDPTHTNHVVVSPKNQGILKESKNGFANGYVNHGFRTTAEKPVAMTTAPKTVVKVNGGTPSSGGRVLTKTVQTGRVSTISIPVTYSSTQNGTRAPSVSGSILQSRAFKDNGRARPRPVSQTLSVSSQTRGVPRNHGNQRDAIVQGPVYVYPAPPRMVRLQPGSQPGKQARYIVVAEPAQEQRWFRPESTYEQRQPKVITEFDHPKPKVITEFDNPHPKVIREFDHPQPKVIREFDHLESKVITESEVPNHKFTREFEHPQPKVISEVDLPKPKVNNELNLAPAAKQGELTVVNRQNEPQGTVQHNITTSEIDVRDVTADDTARMVSSADKLNLGALYLRWSPNVTRRQERQSRVEDSQNGDSRESPESPDSFKIATNTLPMNRENGEVPSPIPTTDGLPNVTAL